MSEELNKTEASMPFLTLEPQLEPEAPEQPENPAALMEETPDCLLYTSDAADE